MDISQPRWLMPGGRGWRKASLCHEPSTSGSFFVYCWREAPLRRDYRESLWCYLKFGFQKSASSVLPKFDEPDVKAILKPWIPVTVAMAREWKLRALKIIEVFVVSLDYILTRRVMIGLKSVASWCFRFSVGKRCIVFSWISSCLIWEFSQWQFLSHSALPPSPTVVDVRMLRRMSIRFFTSTRSGSAEPSSSTSSWRI